MITSLSLSLGKKDKAPNVPMSAPPVADLIPPRSRAARDLRELRRVWTLVVSAVGLLVILAVAGGFGLKLTAQHGLDNEIENQAELTKEIATYKDVNEAISGASDLEAKRMIALQSEVEWTETITKIESALPDDVILESFTGAAGGNPYDSASPSITFVVSIASDRPIAYAEVIDIFSNIENLSNLNIGNLTSDSTTAPGSDKQVKVYKYAVAFGVDDTAYSKRYVVEPETAPADPAAADETPAPTETGTD